MPGKIKILMVVRDVTGVEYHRQLIPHFKLNEHPDFEVSQINEIDSATDEFLKNFHIIHFSRLCSITGKHEELLSRLRSLDVKSVFDIDDYWQLPTNHLLYTHYRVNKIAQQTVECLENADHITCTTPLLADAIDDVVPFHEVTVLKNAIDPEQPQFERSTTDSDRMRFGWIGSVHHNSDLRLMEKSFQILNSDQELKGWYALYLMGFNPGDKSGEYMRFEKIFTKGLTDPNGHYHRIMATNVYSYAQGYNYFDVALAPLAYNQFNICKSELKMIEAGFMKKAIIVSDIYPYTILSQNNSNCLSLKESKYPSWYYAMKRLIKNPSLAKDLSEQLYEDVKDEYHINTVNKIREQLYKTIVE